MAPYICMWSLCCAPAPPIMHLSNTAVVEGAPLLLLLLVLLGGLFLPAKARLLSLSLSVCLCVGVEGGVYPAKMLVACSTMLQ